MKKYKMDKNSITFLFVLVGVTLICITIALIYKLYYKNGVSVIPLERLYYGGIFLITAYVILAIVMHLLLQRSIYYMVVSDGIVICSGLIFEKRIYVKFSSMMYTERLKWCVFPGVNINNLLIHLCGDTLKLLFLSLNDMEEIDNLICVQMKKRGKGL